jgi:hypothetical protein
MGKSNAFEGEIAGFAPKPGCPKLRAMQDIWEG